MAKKRIPELQVELTSDSANFYYLSVLQYRKEHHLVVVDNITSDNVSAYVLDKATQEGIDVKQLLTVITRWFYESSHRYPLSLEFSKLGMTHATNRILKNFELSHVTRIVGQDFQYDLQAAPKIRRRRVNHVPKPEFEVTL
jgi:hypothetical protein